MVLTLRRLQRVDNVHKVDVVTVGQYLQPARGYLSVARYWTPEEFAELERLGAAMGLCLIAAPFVHSSYRAGELV